MIKYCKYKMIREHIYDNIPIALVISDDSMDYFYFFFNFQLILVWFQFQFKLALNSVYYIQSIWYYR